MNPALTYLPLPFLGPYPASGMYGMCLDNAFFNNGSDSLMYVLSERPSFQDKMYIFTLTVLLPDILFSKKLLLLPAMISSMQELRLTAAMIRKRSRSFTPKITTTQETGISML
jgi:hypothetical protein